MIKTDGAKLILNVVCDCCDASMINNEYSLHVMRVDFVYLFRFITKLKDVINTGLMSCWIKYVSLRESLLGIGNFS